MNLQTIGAFFLLAGFLTACRPGTPPTPDATSLPPGAFQNVTGHPVDPLASTSEAAVLIFVRADCPISNRYAPAIQELTKKFSSLAKFWLVYPDPDMTPESARAHLKEYNLKMDALLDPTHELVQKAQATITPEAAVFDPGDQLVYHGRIDDQFMDFNQRRPTPTERTLELVLIAMSEGKSIPISTAPAVGCFITDLEPIR